MAAFPTSHTPLYSIQPIYKGVCYLDSIFEDYSAGPAMAINCEMTGAGRSLEVGSVRRGGGGGIIILHMVHSIKKV